MSINEKLLNIQNELKAPKGQYNSFGKYKYRNAEDILEAVKPLLAKEKLLLALSDEIVQIGDRYYVKSRAKLFDDKEEIEVTAYAREEESKKGMDGSQITGASSSYARKYALNGLFLIDDTKDSDSTNTHGKEDKGAQEVKNEEDLQNKLIDKVKLASIEAELKRTRVPAKQITDRYKIFELKELTLPAYADAMRILGKIPDKPKTDLGL